MNIILGKLNALIRRSQWMNEDMFPDCSKFWNHNKFNIEVVNLGSLSAKYGFNYDSNSAASANWAMKSQSFVGDYAILSNYCSYIKEGATVIIPICPFSFLGGGNLDLSDKYYTIVRPISIPNASLQRRNAVLDIYKNPVKYVPFYSILASIKHIFFRQKKVKVDFEKNADQLIDAWKKEFTIYDLSYPLSLVNLDRYCDSVAALKKLLLFCQSHNYKAIIVFPPITNHLSKKFNEKVRCNYIDNFVKESNITNVPFLNYIDHVELSKDEYYKNSFVLNEKGARLFTDIVMDDISRIK